MVMRTYQENVKYIQSLLQNICLDENNPEDPRIVTLSRKHTETLAKLLSQKKRDKKSELAFIAGFIKEHAEIEDMYDDANEKARIRGILKSYKHGINLTPIKADIQFTYDRKNTMFLNWHNKVSKGMDCVAMELESRGIRLMSENPADQFIEMQELIADSKPTYVKDFYTGEQIKKMIKNEENIK